MKIAIVHDYIKEYGGAERVLEELHKLFPEALVYTSLYAPEYLGPHVWAFRQMEIGTSFLQYIPFKEKLISIFRLISPLVFYSFDLSGFDVIIVSQTGAYFPNLVKKGSAKLICYTHTPPRYLYGYMTAREIKNMFVKAISAIVFHVLRLVDFKASENVDFFIANSEEIRLRIKKFYRRDSVVINPPVNIPSTPGVAGAYTPGVRKKEYYLAGGRLARAKGIDVIVEAFIKNGKALKIFGRGFAGFEEELKSNIPLDSARGKQYPRSKIQFLGEVTDVERQELMTNAKAYVFASYDEDFGITPVEAMAAGTPVIAYRSGGVKETVVDEKTGIFFDENTPAAINSAIKRFESLKISSDACREQSQKFSKKEFDKKIVEFVRKVAKSA